jgi:hypothetical protein
MKTLTFAGAALVVLMASPAGAEDFDGSKKLRCFAGEMLQCAPADKCHRATPEALDFPVFFEVDFKEKRIGGRTAAGREVSSAIQRIVKEPRHTVIQGLEHGRAWSMLIDTATGRLSGAASESGGGFVLFGACLPL